MSEEWGLRGKLYKLRYKEREVKSSKKNETKKKNNISHSRIKPIYSKTTNRQKPKPKCERGRK